ncbi:hypothetical protein [Nannocystis bainbridge]|uniref:Uncharacterized protein n=1 Tax=Nannocystis bainbridge TaxID=2995303 RepID=A0ABT5E485_9BACT|nr:hypothetical protein [Nannocystis bainbridge]MDC0720679.1 hypothetical protein [Nannocystis bainbridge]
MTTLDAHPRPAPPWLAAIAMAVAAYVGADRCVMAQAEPAPVDTRESSTDNRDAMSFPLAAALVSLLLPFALLSACREPEPVELPKDGESCKVVDDGDAPCAEGLTCNTGDGYLGKDGHCATACEGDGECEDGQFCNDEGACTWTCKAEVDSCPVASVELFCTADEGGFCVGAV